MRVNAAPSPVAAAAAAVRRPWWPILVSLLFGIPAAVALPLAVGTWVYYAGSDFSMRFLAMDIAVMVAVWAAPTFAGWLTLLIRGGRTALHVEVGCTAALLLFVFKPA